MSQKPSQHRWLRQSVTIALPCIVALLPAMQANAQSGQVDTKKSAMSGDMFDRTVLPIPPHQKVGKIAPTIKGSDPIQWPQEVAAPRGHPISCSS